MESQPRDPDDVDLDGGAEPEVEDEPMGVPAGADADDSDLPGIPDPDREEPPTAG